MAGSLGQDMEVSISDSCAKARADHGSDLTRETWSMTRRCGTWFAGGFDFGHIDGVPTLHVIISHASTQYASNFVEGSCGI